MAVAFCHIFRIEMDISADCTNRDKRSLSKMDRRRNIQNTEEWANATAITIPNAQRISKEQQMLQSSYAV